MKNVIFYFYSSLPGGMLGVLLDEAKKVLSQGDTRVYFVMCEGFFSNCLSNPKGNLGICALCKNQTRKLIYDALGEKVQILRLSDFYNNTHSEDEIQFSSAEEIKKFKYKQIEIGYGVISSYVHLTRNHQPKVDSISKPYFQNQLLQSIQLIDAFTNIIEEIKPSEISSFNGRFSEIKPVYELALLKNIDVNLYEFEQIGYKKFAKVVFKNTMPHSVSGNRWKFDFCWNDENLLPGENVKLAKEFFYNKRNGKAAGDKIYVKTLGSGELPSNWDENKRNIVIFNSSEDEYVSIGKEYESLALFESQIKGLKFIFEQNKNNSELHFYLRIHPNLEKVKYKYHTDLFNFSSEYSNVTIIGASEKINSYDLLDASEKVIVFGSTIGMEAVYWGKPVILLGCTFYYYEGFCYIPKTTDELKEMILEDLQPIENSINVLKLGLFHYHRNSTFLDKDSIFSYVNFNSIVYKVFNFEVIGYHYQKMFGSTRLKAYYIAFRKVISKMLFNNRFKLPYEDE